jgi:hypothetical protein
MIFSVKAVSKDMGRNFELQISQLRTDQEGLVLRICGIWAICGSISGRQGLVQFFNQRFPRAAGR